MEISHFPEPGKIQEIFKKGPYTLLWSLEGPSTTLVDMQAAQDTLPGILILRDWRGHAFVAVHILLEWEISRKSSGKAYLPLFSELEYSLEHTDG